MLNFFFFLSRFTVFIRWIHGTLLKLIFTFPCFYLFPYSLWQRKKINSVERNCTERHVEREKKAVKMKRNETLNFSQPCFLLSYGPACRQMSSPSRSTNDDSRSCARWDRRRFEKNTFLPLFCCLRALTQRTSRNSKMKIFSPTLKRRRLLGRCWHDVVSSTQHYWSAEGQKGLSTQNWWFIDQSSQKKFISQNESKECRFEIMNNHCNVDDSEIRRQKKSLSRES